MRAVREPPLRNITKYPVRFSTLIFPPFPVDILWTLDYTLAGRFANRPDETLRNIPFASTPSSSHRFLSIYCGRWITRWRDGSRTAHPTRPRGAADEGGSRTAPTKHNETSRSLQHPHLPTVSCRYIVDAGLHAGGTFLEPPTPRDRVGLRMRAVREPPLRKPWSPTHPRGGADIVCLQPL